MSANPSREPGAAVDPSAVAASFAAQTGATERYRARPRFAREMADKYRGGSLVEFILHGNVADLQPLREKDGALRFVSLRQFLVQDLFAGRDMVIGYDEAHGIWFPTPEMALAFHKFMETAALIGGWDPQKSLPRDPRGALEAISNYLSLAALHPKEPKRVAVVIDFAQTVIPAGEIGHLSSDEQACLVMLLKWANDPALLKSDVTILLVAESLSDVNRHLVRSPHVAPVEVPLPDETERREFLSVYLAPDAKMPAATLATLTAGLSRVNLLHLVTEAQRNARALTSEYVGQVKKALIEKECFGLLEFVQPSRTLADVAGSEAAKAWLEGDAKLIAAGRLDALPMGYLFCGPVGTGKSYLAMCFAGSIGTPCVTLRNFRSQWQGVTEGNWEKILSVLRATGPVGVIIDEADAAVGNRDASGDSGTSSRVFSMLAAQMGDTRYRGRIIWFLLTCRPDLLPVDLKRQGRAEVHIPLFPPQGEAEREALYRAMAKKAAVPPEAVAGSMPKDRALTGAEVEAILVRARRRAFLRGVATVEAEDVRAESESFLPPEHGEEIELQTLAAVVECSDRRLLPERWRDADRGELSRRLTDLRGRLGR
jgi:ATP-dependent 26S proteasome regulatory subunit